MWNGKKVSVALPTYNEKESIRECIDQFFATGVVDEVIVCNNNAAPGTSEEVAQTRAVEVFEIRQGYGWSLRKALSEATGDLIVLSEPDGSFVPTDLFKLLSYASDFDVVFGSRTNSALIWSGANMGWFLKWGNWFAAKYLEFMFNTVALTDVGCTMRLLHRRDLDQITPHFTVGTSHFGLEMMLLVIQSRARFIEIPLNYKERVGQSMVTGSFRKTLVLGLQMLFFITWSRLCAAAGRGPAFAER